MTIEQLTTESFDLILKVLEESYELNPPPEVRRAFVYRHLRNILDLGGDVLALERIKRASSSRIIIRTMLEGLFSLVAATKCESFAVEKVIYEVEKNIEGIHRVSKTDTENSFESTIQQLTGLVQKLRSEHNVADKIKWKVFRCAEAADLSPFYIQHYHIYCQYAHATASGIISQEHQYGIWYHHQTLLFIVLCATGHAIPIIGTHTPQAHIDKASDLIAIATDFVQTGKFRELGGLED